MCGCIWEIEVTGVCSSSEDNNACGSVISRVGIRRFKIHHCWILATLLIIQTWLIGHMAWRKSPTNDEIAHLPAAVLYLQHQRFELYRVNPPLARLIAGLPVVLAGPKTDWSSFDASVGKRTEWAVGYDFVEANADRYLWLLFLARVGCLPFALGGTIVLWVWSRDFGGTSAAVLSSTLWAFSPSVLGNAALLTCDVPAAAMGIFAGWRFSCWLKSLATADAFLAGVAAGLAMGTKTVWIILPAIWLPLWLALVWNKARAESLSKMQSRKYGKVVGQPFLAALSCLVTLNSLYGFEGFGRPLGDYQFSSHTLRGEGEKESNNRFADSFLGSVPIPVPVSFLQGIDEQRVDFESARGGYLFGQHREGGVWYYYLAALLVKEPVSYLIVIGSAAILAAKIMWRNRLADRDHVVILWVASLHGLAILGLVSWQSGLNSFYRYLLPAFPFAFLATGVVARHFSRRRFIRYAVLFFMLGGAVESLIIWPHSLSFFNAAVGGPGNGGWYLLGSNLDWGQEYGELERWQERHPEARPLSLIQNNFTPLSLYEIEWQPPPFLDEVSKYRGGEVPEPKRGPPPAGWYAVSPNYIHQSGALTIRTPKSAPKCVPHHQQWFRKADPVDFAGYGLLIFHVPELN